MLEIYCLHQDKEFFLLILEDHLCVNLPFFKKIIKTVETNSHLSNYFEQIGYH